MLAALGEPPDPELDAALGDRAPALRRALVAIAGEWALAVAGPGLAFASDRVDGAGVPGTTSFAEPQHEDIAVALVAALADHSGPLLLVAPDVPRLDRRLSDAALGDLASGCALTFAPATDARPFLLGLASLDRRLLDLVTAGDRRDQVLAAAIELGGEVGLLRSERRLVTPGDARALALDPLARPELARLLR